MLLTLAQRYFETTSSAMLMSWKKFCAHRLVDLLLPGVGLLLDAADACEIAQVCVLDFSV